METLLKKLSHLSESLSRFPLLIEGYHTPLRGIYVGQTLPVALDLSVHVSSLIKGLDVVVSGTVSMEHVARRASLQGEFKGSLNPFTHTFAQLHFLSPKNQTSCRLEVPLSIGDLSLGERSLSLSGKLYMDGELYSELALSLPVEQIMRFFNYREMETGSVS